MISPEILRRYPIFGSLSSDNQKAIAMIAEQVDFQKDSTLLEEGQPANAIYVLEEGDMDLVFIVHEEGRSHLSKIYNVGELNPGELFGISGLIEPYLYSTSVRAASDGRVIKIDAVALRALFELDQRMAYTLMRQVAKAALERLSATRVQLAAAR